ncbi:MAG: 23S rRNA pseudouridine(1911/1915/1917) synthase RluD [Gammaproteobacteria bacterium]|nr:23S rRNA pseudouridine(1911/1915/1917) synthase RluD [Gammaproteobacteria bacterium]MDH5800744.1 23S rRNA pseudouridine(1911/1915/1917) synthase RluD [Gammaproteobacteria bacterium]
MTDSYFKVQIPSQCSGDRLDIALTTLFPEFSRSRLQKWIKQGLVQVDHEYRKPKDTVHEGEWVEVWASVEQSNQWQAQAIDLEVVYEDEDIIVINKPAGLVVHPGAGNPDGTLSNGLLYAYPQLTSVPRAGVIHRLDKDTTGLLVVARTLAAHKTLVEQLQAREFERCYQALCCGVLNSGGTVDQPIRRHPLHRTRMAVVSGGKEAVTHYRVGERFRFHTLLNVRLETGRTHQIRVHMAFIHHPLVGDPTYGGRLKLSSNCSERFTTELRSFKRQALHAQKLGLQHPRSGEVLQWEAPLPEDMMSLIAAAREDAEAGC